MSMPRRQGGDVLSWLSRVSFVLSYLLAMSTPAWEQGTFTHVPVLRFRLSGQRFQVGVLTLLPLLSAVAWGVAHVVQRPARGWRWGPRHALLPVIGFGAWSLIRIWPIHIQHTALVTAVSIALFWSTYLYLLQEQGERWALWLVAALVTVQGGVAVLQFARQSALGLSALGELAIDPQGQGASVIEAGGRRWLRAYGLTPHPNVLGGYLGMGLLVCLGALVFGRAGWRRWLWVPLILAAKGLGRRHRLGRCCRRFERPVSRSAGHTLSAPEQPARSNIDPGALGRHAAGLGTDPDGPAERDWVGLLYRRVVGRRR